MNRKIYTIGHSTLPLVDFLQTIKTFSIQQVVDVRTIPGSRHSPQFNKDHMDSSLLQHGIGYMHLPGLGGLRHASRDSINTGWKNASFRGYADYMQTEGFNEALRELINLAERSLSVIMCAEALPWRCHRSLIGDALVVRGFDVEDIIGNNARSHRLTTWAKVEDERIMYPVSNV